MKLIYKLAGVAAVAALFVYALSCRPAWSPDSKMVSFVYMCDVEKETGAVAVHNLETGVTKRVFSFAEDSSIKCPQTFWVGDKVSLLAAMGDKKEGKRTLLLSINPDTQAFESIRVFHMDLEEPLLIMPPVIDDAGNIWLTSEDNGEYALHKITPDGKSAVPVGKGPAAYLARGGDRIFFISELGGNFPTSMHRRKLVDTEKGLTCATVGLFHPDEERFEVRLWQAGIKEFFPLIAASPDGENVSFYCKLENEDYALHFLKDKSPAGVKLPNKVSQIAGLCFSSNSETVWTVYLPDNAGDAAALPVLAQIHPEKGVLRTRELPLGGEGIELQEECTLALQPAISPDGKWLAICSFPFEKKASGKLLLVDLESEELDIRVVQPPMDE